MENTQDVGRFYTQTRRFKKMLGRFHDGTPIPGGPYNVTQGCVGVLTMFGLLWTNRIWTTGYELVDLVIGLGIVWGVAWLVGKLPATKRSPLTVGVDAFRAMTTPASGKFKGNKLKIRPPHRAYQPTRTNGLTVATPYPTPITQKPHEIIAPVSIDPGDVITTPTPLKSLPGSAVQRLLAQTQQH